MNSIDKSGRFSEALDFLRRHGGIKIVLIILAGIILITLGLNAGAESNGEADLDETEAKLEQLCSSISGVGKCQVMVTYEKSASRYGTSEARRVESVAIACKGADSVTVRSELTKLLTALFGIGSNRISITKMK